MLLAEKSDQGIFLVYRERNLLWLLSPNFCNPGVRNGTTTGEKPCGNYGTVARRPDAVAFVPLFVPITGTNVNRYPQNH
jgi:hypothetical protein